MSERVENRDKRILESALELAAAKGYERVRRSEVATHAGVAAGSVNNAFGTMEGLRDAIMAEAVRTEHYAVVAQGLATGHPVARAAPQALKDSALRSLAA